MTFVDAVQPGDVIVVRTKSPWGIFVRLAAWLQRKPDTVDHVAIVHHRDLAGITWAIEGRPGGVGWVDIRAYDNPWMVTNAAQSKTPEQRKLVCDLAEQLLRTPYDWPAIVHDAMSALHIRDMWASKDFGDKPPGQVVCSSFASWLYRQAGLAEPAGRMRWIEPCDWAAWCAAKGWR